MPILFYFILLCLVPLWWIQRSRGTTPSIAIGQFLFFSANEYRSIGGHEAVKARLLEDVWLGREMARNKYKQITLDLSPIVSCQMYREFGTMWDGIARWLYSIASLSIFIFIVFIFMALLLFMAPFLWLAHDVLFTQAAFGLQAIIFIQVAILLLARFLAGRRFSQPTSSAVLHPLGIGFLLLVAVYALSKYVRGGGVTWKERVYGPESQVS
jgi:chlorobactene glucosyltransferase